MSSFFSLDQLVQMLLEDWSEVFIQFHSLDRRLALLRGLEEVQAHAPLFKCVLEFKELLKEFPFEGEYPGPKVTPRFEDDPSAPPHLQEKLETFMKSIFFTAWECRAKLELAKRFVRVSQSRAKLQALLPVFRLLKVSITEVAHLLETTSSRVENAPSGSKSFFFEQKALNANNQTPNSKSHYTTIFSATAAPAASTYSASVPSPSNSSSSVNNAALVHSKDTSGSGASSGGTSNAVSKVTMMKYSASNAHLNGWIHLAHIRNRTKGKNKKSWVTLDALALATSAQDMSAAAVAMDALKSTTDLSLYPIAEISLLVPADKRDEHLLEARLGSAKDLGFVLLFESRTDLARWAVAIDSLRAYAATGQFLMDHHTRQSLLATAWQEPYNGGVLTARTRDGHIEEWSYRANGSFECMSLPIGDSLYQWDGSSLRPGNGLSHSDVSAAASATATVSQGFSTFDGVFLVFYGVSAAVSDRYSWHPIDKEFRRTADSPAWDLKQYVVQLGSGGTLKSPAPTEICVEGSIPPPVVMSIMCMRGWTNVRK